MGFLDKAKEKAAVLAGQAKDKYEDVQARRKADDFLDDLGRIVYGAQTGRPVDNAEAETARLVEELKKIEAEGIEILAAKPAAGEPPADGGPSLPPPVPS